MTPSRTFRRVSVLLGLAALAVALWAAAVGAHSLVRSTDPKASSTVQKAPAAVVIRFNEPVELAFGGIQVLDPDRRRVDAGKTRHSAGRRDTVRVGLAPDLANGQYSVVWRIVAADGHPRSSRFRFRLDQPAPPTTTSSGAHAAATAPPGTPAADAAMAPGQQGQAGAGALPAVLLGATRWVLFASLLVLAGLGVFALAVWRPAGSAARPAGMDQAFERRWGRLIRWAWAAAVVASLASLPLQGAVAADVRPGEAFSGEVLGAVLDTRFGLVTLGRLALLVVLAAAVLAGRPGRPRRTLVRADARRSLGAAAAPAALPVGPLVAWTILGVALLATVGLAGHAGTTSPVALGMAADLLHLSGLACWLGGLVGLVAVALPAARGAGDRERVTVLAPVVSRFSNLAVASVAVIAGTGTVRAWMEVRTLEGLTGDAYGITLLVKLAVVACLLTLGAVNNRWTKPRIQRAAEAAELTGQGASALGTLRRLVLLEVLLAAVVLAVAATLVNLQPPHVGMGMEAGQ
jgi:copper transport protein